MWMVYKGNVLVPHGEEAGADFLSVGEGLWLGQGHVGTRPATREEKGGDDPEGSMKEEGGGARFWTGQQG